MLSFSIRYPIFTSRKINRNSALMAGGRAGATWIRKRIRSGQDAGFDPIPPRKDVYDAGHTPMVDTKQLLNSIRAGRRRKYTRAGQGAQVTISPRGKDSKGVPNATKAAVAKLHRSVDLMGVDATMDKIIRQAIKRAIARQLEKQKGAALIDSYKVRSSD